MSILRRSLIVVLALMGVMAASASAKPIPGHYIVKVKPGANATAVAAIAGAKPKLVYDTVLNGFAAELTDAQVNGLSHNPHVDAIEADQEVASEVTQNVGGGLWGLDRIDQFSLPLSGTYTYTRTGTGVTAYVIDSGVAPNTTEFRSEEHTSELQ